MLTTQSRKRASRSAEVANFYHLLNYLYETCNTNEGCRLNLSKMRTNFNIRDSRLPEFLQEVNILVILKKGRSTTWKWNTSREPFGSMAEQTQNLFYKWKNNRRIHTVVKHEITPFPKRSSQTCLDLAIKPVSPVSERIIPMDAMPVGQIIDLKKQEKDQKVQSLREQIKDLERMIHTLTEVVAKQNHKNIKAIKEATEAKQDLELLKDLLFSGKLKTKILGINFNSTINI